jgi:hypothetical protein|tara:strand:- start:227 stop:568 length:342 start_codon:yes stop_codon:yes gene_type:complete
VKNRRTRPFKRSNNRHSGDSFVNGNSSTRVRGNLSTVLEKYKDLAKDAAASGDHVGAENYLQHAEHYSRLINDRQERNNGNGEAKASKTESTEEKTVHVETLDPAKAIEEANS